MAPTRITASRSRRLLAASMLGVGALLQPRARTDDHWSASPVLTADAAVRGETAGDPPTRDLAPIDPVGGPERAPRRRRPRRRWFRRRP